MNDANYSRDPGGDDEPEPPAVERVRFAAIALVGLLACFGPGTQAEAASGSNGRWTAHSSGSAHSHSPSHSSPKSTAHNKATPGVARDAHGKIARSPQALQQFKKSHPCPGTGKTYGSCPGYVVDHVIPLKRGGPDVPGNMQWQTKEEAKQKDRWE